VVAIQLVEFEDLPDEIIENPFPTLNRETLNEAGISCYPLPKDDVGPDGARIFEKGSFIWRKEVPFRHEDEGFDSLRSEVEISRICFACQVVISKKLEVSLPSFS
jgi:hypothetical protein